MNIYFAGSIRAGRDDAPIYMQIIEHLKNYGTVLTEHVGDSKLSTDGEKNLPERFIHDRDLEWLLNSDVLVAEVTTASLGVGYEIGRAVEHEKKVLCLYRPQDGKKLSAMIAGCPDVAIANYNHIEEAKLAIDKFFAAKFVKPD